jgi:hypothetical protein
LEVLPNAIFLDVFAVIVDNDFSFCLGFTNDDCFSLSQFRFFATTIAGHNFVDRKKTQKPSRNIMAKQTHVPIIKNVCKKAHGLSTALVITGCLSCGILRLPLRSRCNGINERKIYIYLYVYEYIIQI